MLENGRFIPVGGRAEKHVDVRILATTNTDLQQKIETGEFREELYYRVAGFPIPVPPLRKRKEDIPLLADHLLLRLATEMGVEKAFISPDAIATLVMYDFPGNVRELKNILERAMISCRDQTIRTEHLHFTRRTSVHVRSSTAENLDFLIGETVKGHIGYSEAMNHIQR